MSVPDFERQIHDASMTALFPMEEPDGLMEQLRTVSELLEALPVAPVEPCLVFRDPAGAIRQHGIGAGLVFGRSVECDIPFPAHREVSKQHFEIRPQETEFVLVDLDSTNGVLVNSSPEPVRERVLADGDLIRVAAFRFAFLRSFPPADLPEEEGQNF